jgi:hypothetical protein
MDYFIPATQAEFDYIVEKFRAKTLPAEEWTHEAHLIAGLWHIAHFSFEEALPLMRENIKAYNVANGNQNTDTGGYHETITVFWLWLLNEFWKRKSSENLDFEQICYAFLRSKYSSRNNALYFYTDKVLFSREARLNFVEPDIQPFDFSVI